LGSSKFYDWRKRYGKVNEHNALLPRDDWLQAWEKKAILDFHDRNPLEGYRRLTFMMLDADIVAVSQSSVYRVLKQAGRLDRRWLKPSKKGTGFVQPLAPHEHWHVDVSYVNVAGTFYYLISVLDGYSRAIVHGELRESMTESDVEIVIQRAIEKHSDVFNAETLNPPGQVSPEGRLPEMAAAILRQTSADNPLGPPVPARKGRPRIISDNGPQFIAKEFKEFIRLCGMTHVRTSPYYPQSNGKLERWHGTAKRECIRPAAPRSVEEARRRVAAYVEHYNTVRLHGAIGYVTPADKLAGRERQIWAARDAKLQAARERRAAQRQAERAMIA
jgi:putative transposase